VIAYSVFEDLRSDILARLDLEGQGLDAERNLLSAGLDSIDLMEILEAIKRTGVNATMLDLYRVPTLKAWGQLLARERRSVSKYFPDKKLPTMLDETPFALTPVQHAYLVGRSHSQVLGGVGCHLYQEFDGHGLTSSQLEEALWRLRERHRMLSVSFQEDGTQRYREVRHNRTPLAVHDLREMGSDQVAAFLEETRQTLSHRLMEVDRGETFDVKLSLLPNGRHRIHTNIDLLIADAASYSILLEDLSNLILGKELPAVHEEFDFCSYLTSRTGTDGHVREQARAFWKSSLESLPLAPGLPLAVPPESIRFPRTRRRRYLLQIPEWVQFRKNAGLCGLTAPMALATCYSAVIARWSGQSKLLLNATLFDRALIHPAVERMVADFTNVLLLGMDCGGECFAEDAQKNQESFAACYEHASYSGVEVMRDLKKLGNHPHGAPIVFTSNIGRSMLAANIRPVLGELGWGISQTPQVWIDHQALEDQDSLILQWDCNDELFPPDLLDQMFEAYVNTVRDLAKDPDLWNQRLPDVLPTSQRNTRLLVNSVSAQPPDGLLQDAFFRNAKYTPDATAIIDGDQQLSYFELAEHARRLAHLLRSKNIEAGDSVAVTIPRGIGQVISVLAILQAGAIYIPVSLDQPIERREQIYTNAAIKAVIRCAHEHIPEFSSPFLEIYWQYGLTHSLSLNEEVRGSNEDPAYVIYTSGSTGTPKGVVISHRGALNTCADITKRFGIHKDDKALALSSLHFDLSVYDIFGILGAGGTLVLLREEQRRDPGVWSELIERHHITIWNSVPALFDMLLTYNEGFELLAPAHLRLVMLSGDWIGLDLPDRYHAFRPDGRFIAMGGATEASIWSNFFEVGQVHPTWRSIPYGKPLANQKFRVVDMLGRDCPDWCPGELWIGGVGVAGGYHNDEERTREQFIDLDKERWYRTGDLGCYWPDGTLEFLGRKDRQVKVGGYRIELGEVDAALNKLEGIRSALTIAIGDRDKSLASFVIAEDEAFATPKARQDRTRLEFSSPPNSEFHEGRLEQDASRLLADFLANHLAMQGVAFTSPLFGTECGEQYGVVPGYLPLMQKWLDHLIANGLLEQDELERYVRGPEYGRDQWRPTPSDDLYPVYEALSGYDSLLLSIVQGRSSAEALYDHPFWSPESLQLRLPGSIDLLDALADVIAQLARDTRGPIKVVEIGARSGLAALRLLERVDLERIQYTLLDDSAEMVLRCRARLSSYPNTSSRRRDLTAIDDLQHTADLVFSNNALHRHASPERLLVDAQKLMATEARLIVHEVEIAPVLGLVSVDLFATKPSSASGPRDRPTWLQTFQTVGLKCDIADSCKAVMRFVLRSSATSRVHDPQQLRDALSKKLPAYMLPQRTVFIDSFPLTANGKIDHSALMVAVNLGSKSPMLLKENLQTEAEKVVFRLWQKLLQIDQPQRDAHFFDLGGDSLLATRLIGELAREGYRTHLADLFASPTLSAFAATLQKDETITPENISWNAESRYDPFPLTEVQHAYLAGRGAAFALGGIGSHFFMEFAVQDLDVSRFEACWNRLIDRHDMLRAVVRNGMQQVLQHVPPLSIKVHECEIVFSPEGDAIRERLAHKVIDPEHWPVFTVEILRDSGAISRVLIGLDNLLLDGMSMQIVMDELTKIYLEPAITLPPIEIGYRDYVIHQAEHGQPSDVSREYWRSRITHLPPGPQLPLLKDPSTVLRPKFSRLSHRLPATTWSALKSHASRMQLTASGLLLNAYASVLSASSARPDLSLNVTFFDRKPIHPHIDRVAGDFTSLFVLAWKPEGNWISSAVALQRRLQEDMSHRDVSSIQVMRYLAQEHGTPIAFPVVFTSALGYERGSGILSRSSWLKPIGGISQTPQVWLDHQVYESDGELVLNWDAASDLLDQHLLQTMFQQYTSLLVQLSCDEQAWRLPLEELIPRKKQIESISSAKPVSIHRDLLPIHDHTLSQELCRVFSVEIRPIKPHQNFFEAGASSLDLVRLHLRLTESGYQELSITDLFSYPSPNALAARLSSLGATTTVASASDRQNLLTQRAARRERRTLATVETQN